MGFRVLGDDDLSLFQEGTHLRLYEKLGAHRCEVGGTWGTHFAVWAPHARDVQVIGDFNGWDRSAHGLARQGSSGIWAGFVPGVELGCRYRFWIASQQADHGL